MARLDPVFFALPLTQEQPDTPPAAAPATAPVDKREQNRLAQQRFRDKHKAPNEQAAAAWAALQEARRIQAAARAAHEEAKGRTNELRLVWEQACKEQS